jgi:predicted PurR-regulated permease PerM
MPMAGTSASHRARGLSIRDYLERLMPPGSRGRQLVGWGLVAWTFIGGGVVLWVLARAIERIAGVFPYLVMAALVVFVLNPAVRRLTRLGVPRRLAATLVFVVAVVLTVFILSLAIPVLVSQTRHLIASSPGLLRKGGSPFERLSRSHNAVLHRAGVTIVSWIQAHAGNAPKAIRTLTTAGLQLAHFGVVLIIGGFLGFLVLLSLPETTRGFTAMIPPGSRDRVGPALEEFKRIMTGYVRARLIVSAVVGIIATIGLWAIHMPFWLVLGVVVGVANLIPMLGSWIGGIPVGLVALVTKPPSFLFVVLAVIVVAHTVDGYILSPIVLKETTRLHPVVILLAVLLGADLLGFWGIIAAIPVAGIIQFALREWIVPRITGVSPPQEPAPAGEPAMGAPG